MENKIKLFSRFLLGACLPIMASCGDKIEPLPDPEPEIMATDLSEDEMANCYIVTSPGLYKFKADNQFNLGEGLPVPPEISPVSASLVWQTHKESISTVDFIEDYIIFEVENAEGNALIAALDEDGNIEWTWHIWMPSEEVYSITSATGYEVMNMNLGALTDTPGEVSSYGLLYQWGRKDPFPAAPSLRGDVSTTGAPLYDIEGQRVTITNSSWENTSVNNIAYSISHPTVCLSNYSQYLSSRDWLRADMSDDSLWGNPKGETKDSEGHYINKGRKTCYDPSPAGWMVAPPDAFRNFTSSGGYTWVWDDFNISDTNGDGEISLADYNYGWHFNLNSGVGVYFPAAARYDGSYAMLMGSVSGLWGNYWSNSPYSSISGGAFCALAFQVEDQTGKEVVTVSPSGGASRADAYSIRCVRCP